MVGLRSHTVDVAEVLDAAPLNGALVRVVLLCGLTAMIDGFDVQALSFVVPVLVRAWEVPASAFALIFSAGLLGLMVGQFLFTPLADRLGRKAMIMAGMILFGLVSLVTALAQDLQTLLILRFIGGVGLGGVMPNLIALTAEYSPSRLRATAVTVMFGGFSLGAVAGGLLSSVMIPAFGWPSIFVLGGVAPLALAVVLAVWLPESLRILLLRSTDTAKVSRILERHAPQYRADDGATLTLSEPTAKGFTVKGLFAPQYRATTMLLWPIYFVSLLLAYVLLSWLPTVLSADGVPIPTAQRMGAVLSMGAVVGGIVLGMISDKLRPVPVLIAAYALAGICITLLGVAGRNEAALTTIAFAAGFFTIGGQTALNAMVATFYPTSIRATGLGYAMGVGRLGSIVGPIVGGAMIAADWSAASLFAVSACPAVLACLLLFVLGTVRRRGEAGEASAAQDAANALAQRIKS